MFLSEAVVIADSDDIKVIIDGAEIEFTDAASVIRNDVTIPTKMIYSSLVEDI